MSASVQKLAAARDLVARPGGWTQGEAARALDGRAVRYDDDEAVCFCAYGALWRVGVPLFAEKGAVPDEERLLQEAIGTHEIGVWNDELSQAEVVAAFDRAIQLAEAQS